MTRDEMEQEFRSALTPHFPGRIPEGLVRSLVLAAGGYAATQIEEHARPYPWPPRRQRQDEGQAARRQQPERESA